MPVYNQTLETSVFHNPMAATRDSSITNYEFRKPMDKGAFNSGYSCHQVRLWGISRITCTLTCLIFSLGDQFARWTSRFTCQCSLHWFQWYHLDDIFKSTFHRAVNSNSVDRYAIPLFFGTDYNVKLEVGFRAHYSGALRLRCIQPIPGCVSPECPSRYENVTAGEYVKSRLEATYNHKY